MMLTTFVIDFPLVKKNMQLYPEDLVNHTLSGRTGCTTAWHFEGRAFASHWLEQVLRFVSHIYTVQVELEASVQ